MLDELSVEIQIRKRYILAQTSLPVRFHHTGQLSGARSITVDFGFSTSASSTVNEAIVFHRNMLAAEACVSDIAVRRTVLYRRTAVLDKLVQHRR